MDPGAIRNWGFLVFCTVVVILSVHTEVATSRANDLRHDDSIKAIEVTVKGISEILEKQIQQIDEKEKIKAAERRLMRRLCKNPEFKRTNEMQCELASMDR